MARGRRRARNGRRSLPPRVIPYDFAAQYKTANKGVTLAMLDIKINRPMRPFAVRITASFSAPVGVAFPIFFFALYGPSDVDNIALSSNVALSGTTQRLYVRAPRGTDFGDYPHDGNVLQFLSSGFNQNGTFSVSGTVWMQFAPHKVATTLTLESRLARLALMCDSTDSQKDGSGPSSFDTL